MNDNENSFEKEDNEIVDFHLLKKIMNSGKEKCVCKITQEINKNGNLYLITGTGFFSIIPSKNIKIFLTNNHVLNQEFLDNEKYLIIFIEEKKREINLKIDRFKFTDKEFDFTIIEILPFLDIGPQNKN